MNLTLETTKPKNQALSRPSFIQPKLNINTLGDTHEQEANATADKVMRMHTPGSEGSFLRPAGSDPFIKPANGAKNSFFKPANGGNNPFFKPAIKPVQRKHHGPDASEDEQLHRKEISILRKWNGLEGEDKMLHLKESTGAETQASSGLDSYINSLGSSGQPLPDASRQFFEPRFGHDFSGVRIHNDSVAAKSAQSINALAYTTGNNIVFNEGQYAPGSDSGNRLLAHELTHVVQQRGGKGTLMRKEKENDQFIKDVKAELQKQTESLKDTIAKKEAKIQADYEHDKTYLNVKLGKEYDKLSDERKRKEPKDQYLTRKIKEFLDSEKKSVGLDKLNQRLQYLQDLTDFFTNHNFTDNSLTLGKVVRNEAGTSEQRAKEWIGYAYMNKTGGTVREPKGSEISEYKNLSAVWKTFKGESAKTEFLTHLKDSIQAADKVLSDKDRVANDPTEGATNWISPNAMPTSPTSNNPLKRTINGQVRYVPNWARSNSDPDLKKLMTGPNAILNSNFKEINFTNSKKEVDYSFIFFKGVKGN